MTLFNDPYLLLATFSLLIQVAVLLLLVYGYWQKRQLKYERHGRVMATAVAVHLTMIFVVMIPGLVLALIPIFIVPHISGLTSIVTFIHAPLGVTSISLGVWLAVAWRFSGVQGCFKRKKFMLATIVLWPTTLVMGITLYFVLYWSALMG